MELVKANVDDVPVTRHVEENSCSRPMNAKNNNRDHVKSFVAALGASLMTTLSSLMFKYYEWLPPFEGNFFMLSSCFIIMSPLWLASTRIDNRSVSHLKEKTVIISMLINSVSTFLGSAFYAQALTQISTSMVYLFANSSPIFSFIFSRILFKEKLNAPKLFALAFIVSGTLLTGLSGFSFKEFSYSESLVRGISFTLAGSVMGSVMYVSGKKISHLDTSSVLLGQGVVGTIFSSIALVISGTFWLPSWGKVPFVMLIFGVAYALGLLADYLSCKYGDVGMATSTIMGLNVCFSFIWDVSLLKYRPSYPQYVAGALVLLGSALNGFGKCDAVGKFFKNNFRI